MAIQGAYAEGRAARPSDLADWGPRVLFFLFFVPPVIFIACGPLYVAFGQADFWYRAFQTIWGAALLTIALWMSQRFNLRLSGTAKFVASFLMLSAIVQFATQAFTHRTDYEIESLQTTLLFLSMFLGFDLVARRFTFAQFAEDASYIAAAVIVAGAIHVTFFAVKVWGRALYFDQHPNLGGEIVFAATVLVAFSRRTWLRFLCYGLSLLTLLALESRAAMIGAAVLIALVDVPRRNETLRVALLAGFAGVAAICIGMLVSPSLADDVSRFISEDVLMVSNPYRGAGTGFAGRSETWVMAWHHLVAHPLFGTGLNLSGKTVLGDPVHNGYIKNLAEFGVPGMMLNVLLLAAIPMGFRQDWRRGAVVLACNLVYFFNARNVNLSVYPLLLWIAILPWLPTASTAPGAAAERR